ncbi:Type-2 restriction enzyme Sau3AI [Neisseria animalis]|nr:Type-2 restriction enzyme Sau3AI [Neisseria animalis]
MVLNIINYEQIVNQDFANSSFLLKNAHILLVFYVYDRNQSVFEYPIRLVGLWDFPNDDLNIIRQDWQTIQQKVKSGKAHELSEGDTFYLGACTKGTNAESLRTQPFSHIPAKQRAFSLKQGYVNHIIAQLSGISDGSFGKILRTSDKKSLENTVIDRFSLYYGLSETEIIDKLNLSEQRKSKQFYAILTKAILGIDSDKEIEEFSKADIVVKTIRIQEKNNLPKEHISFPSFKYTEIFNEKSWEESSLHQLIDKKFLFVFFKYSGNTLFLEKVVFWTMPYDDKKQAFKIWQDLKALLTSGQIVKSIYKKSGRRATYFTDIKNNVMHVRPHARNAADTYPLPKADVLTRLTSYTKHCFWLNAEYVRDEIYLKNIDHFVRFR